MARRPSSQRQYVPQAMPGFLEFQHPRLVTQPPNGEAWLHEIKFDGYRMQAHVQAGRVTLFTRRGFDWTQKLPQLAGVLSGCADCILDGELCFIGPNGQPTFSGLRAAIGRGQTKGLVFFVFDVLCGEGTTCGPSRSAIARRSWRRSSRQRQARSCGWSIAFPPAARPCSPPPAAWGSRASSPSEGTLVIGRGGARPG